MACKIEDKTLWGNIKQENPTLNTNDSQDVTQHNTKIIPQSPKERLKQKRMTKAEKVRALNMHFFIDNLIPCGYHIVIYGAAGSGKTTIALYLGLQIILSHPKSEIYYLYLDGQLGMAAGYEKYLEDTGVQWHRYNILTNGYIDEMLDLIEASVARGESKAENLVVILDTLKYLNPNINNKDSNVKAMQRIKKLTSKGITIISLHHTNKDGGNYSGTAEIEQDGDALLKIVTAPGDDEHSRISTIQEGGRIRYFMEPKSFSFIQGNPSSVQELGEVIDPKKILKQTEDANAISTIKGILTLKGTLTKTELEKFLKDDDNFDYSEKERKQILRDYIGIHWSISKSGERKHIHNYTSIDHTSEIIDKINDTLRVQNK